MLTVRFMTFRSIFVILVITALALTIVTDQEAVFGNGTYVGSIEGDCYHKASCRYAKNIKDGNLIVFADECDAANRGYRSCKVCSPLECQTASQETSEQQTTTSPAPEPKTTIPPKTTATQTSESKMTTQKEITPTPESTPMTTSSDGGSLIVPAVSILGLAAIGGYILKRRSSQAKSNFASSEA